MSKTSPSKHQASAGSVGLFTRQRLGQIALAAAVLFCLSPWGQPQLGLAIGIGLALAGLNLWPTQTRKVSRWLIQGCIVLLGLRINLHEVLRAGSQGIVFAAATIVGAFVVGLVLARLFKVEGKLATMLCSGTAVCGGSAIAATSSVIKAPPGPTSIALACVFVLNAVAIYLFPYLGDRLQLSDSQFGAWCAVAIHDVASVVASAQVFDQLHHTHSQDPATVIKLARVLWIIPIAMIAGTYWQQRDGNFAERIDTPGARQSGMSLNWRGLLPWFIGGFLIASALRTWLLPNVLERIEPQVKVAANAGMSVALLLIGCGLSVKAIREVGWRALAMAAILWVVLSAASVAVIRATYP